MRNLLEVLRGRMLGEMQGCLVESCKEFVRSLVFESCEQFDIRIARYLIELVVVRRMLGEMQVV